jgi:hypothetical protein
MKNIYQVLKRTGRNTGYGYSISTSSIWLILYAGIGGHTGMFWHKMQNTLLKTIWDEELDLAMELELASHYRDILERV